MGIDEIEQLSEVPSYETGWAKVFELNGDYWWEMDGRRIKITGAELERLKSTNAGKEEES